MSYVEQINRDDERITITKVKFSKIERLPTMEAVRQYLDWDASVRPLPGSGEWFADKEQSWEERRQARLARLAQEKEEKRVIASNPNKPRKGSQQFSLNEFLAIQEAKHDSLLLAMFQAAMMERKLRSAPLALYEKLWDKFLVENNG